jgi:hypothetical protein
MYFKSSLTSKQCIESLRFGFGNQRLLKELFTTGRMKWNLNSRGFHLVTIYTRKKTNLRVIYGIARGIYDVAINNM